MSAVCSDAVAGAAGLEPANGGVKVRCVTTSPRPFVVVRRTLSRPGNGGSPRARGKNNGIGISPNPAVYGVGKGTRTLDTRNHNPVL